MTLNIGYAARWSLCGGSATGCDSERWAFVAMGNVCERADWHCGSCFIPSAPEWKPKANRNSANWSCGCGHSDSRIGVAGLRPGASPGSTMGWGFDRFAVGGCSCPPGSVCLGGVAITSTLGCSCHRADTSDLLPAQARPLRGKQPLRAYTILLKSWYIIDFSLVGARQCRAPTWAFSLVLECDREMSVMVRSTHTVVTDTKKSRFSKIRKFLARTEKTLQEPYL